MPFTPVGLWAVVPLGIAKVPVFEAALITPPDAIILRFPVKSPFCTYALDVEELTVIVLIELPK